VGAQRKGKKAVEAAIDALAPGPGKTLYVSPTLIADNIQGRARLDEPNLKPLRDFYGVTFIELTEAVTCADRERGETCHFPDDVVFYEFEMPRPIEAGVLTMRVLRYVEGGGDDGQIAREAWVVQLVQRPDTGWLAVNKQLEATANGAW
jgi:hypothetical protein